MKNYDEICASIGYDRRAKGPQLTYCWIGYDKGNVIRCKSQFDASKYTLNERVVDPESKESHDKFFDSVRQFETIAGNLFENELRLNYPDISDDLFYICYAECYDRGHSSGYDEVATLMISVVDFAKNVRSVI